MLVACYAVIIRATGSAACLAAEEQQSHSVETDRRAVELRQCQQGTGPGETPLLLLLTYGIHNVMEDTCMSSGMLQTNPVLHCSSTATVALFQAPFQLSDSTARHDMRRTAAAATHLPSLLNVTSAPGSRSAVACSSACLPTTTTLLLGAQLCRSSARSGHTPMNPWGRSCRT
jgi:hypothetical protein